jgi:hypothetical protein
MTLTTSLVRAAALVLGLATMPAAAADQFPSRDFFMNQWGGLNACHRATADTEVEWCSGEAPTTSTANPARFNCRHAEVDAEYEYCGKPFPKRRR